jgi:LPS export ABC transporter protein LptC
LITGSVLVVPVLGLALVLGAGCGWEEEADPGRGASRMGGEIPDQEITDFVLRETNEDGSRAWILDAAEARIFESRDEVDARTIHIDFYNKDGEVSSVLTADRGVIERRTNDMRALGNVVVRNSEGHELSTEELWYSTKRNKIFTDQFVTVVRGRDVLTGYGLESDPDLARGQFELKRDVQATVRDGPGIDGNP